MHVQPQLKGVVFEPAQTSTARKTLNPVWHEQLRCDVSDDCLLQVTRLVKQPDDSPGQTTR
jgi:hypothetical protein